MSTRRGSLDRLAAESTQSRAVPDGRTARRDRGVPTLTIAWHPDVARVGERVALVELATAQRDARVELSRLAPRFASADNEPFPLADRFLSRRPIRLRAGRDPGSVDLDASDSGLDVEVDGTPLDGDTIDLGSERLRRGVTLMLSGRVVLILHTTRGLAPPSTPSFGLVGDSDGLRRVRSEIARVADLDIPVLIRGATGTGKELVAEAIHQHGSRRHAARGASSGGPFLALNLAAIPPSLAAAELFGAAKGAYSGATTTTPGYFRRARGGTLFLDEIGEISTEVQAMLLRALETGEIQPIGGDRPARSDVRLIAATDADLEAAIDAGTFRAPLLHRLASYTIHLPRLAERRDDVGRLFLHFLRHELDALDRAERLDAADGANPWLPASWVARLTAHDWPGNVRELRNVARHLAVAWSDADEVPAAAIESLSAPVATAARAPRDAARGDASANRYKPPSEIDDDALRAALRAHRFATRPTARALGISRTSLYGLIERSPTLRKAADLDAEAIRRALDTHGGSLAAAAFDLEVSTRGLGRRAAELGIPSRYFEAKTRK